MNISLTLCDKNLHGGVPTYEFKKIPKKKKTNEAQELFHHWLEVKNLEKSVLVCFENIRGLQIKELRNEHKSILVSHKREDIKDFCDKNLKGGASYDVDFAVFEFENYQRAFSFLINLRESF